MRRVLLAPAIFGLGACAFVAGLSDHELRREPDAGSAAAPEGGAAAPGRDGAAASTAFVKPITFDKSNLKNEIFDFPVWIDVIDPRLAAVARADGRDVSFTAEDGTTLPSEIQRWNAASARLSAWVRVPRLSNVTSTTINLRYGDGVEAPPTPSALVFSASFDAVWHLDDALTSTTIADATGLRASTAIGLAKTQQVSAKLGGGIEFSGGPEEITFDNPLRRDSPHTISAWIAQQPTNDNDALLVLGGAQCGGARWFHSRYNDSSASVGFYCYDWSTLSLPLVGSGWTLVHWVFEGTNGVNRMYRDGALIAGPFTNVGSPRIDTQEGPGHIGNAPPAWGQSMGLHATVDEIRIAHVARAPEWIAAEFANQSAPSKFYQVGAERAAP